ncbi:MAG TPA: NADP-dependent oxidoreductase [Stellaceae bacterium]|nr:NADP-dependent oxidoreductase [Stellaceae bacterium]
MAGKQTNTRVLLAERPGNRPVRESDFRIEQAPVAEPADGEVLLRTLWLSLDPYMRGRMSTARSYAKPVEIGAVMTGETVSEVVASRAPGLKPGDVVLAHAGWQEWAALPAKEAQRIEPGDMPLSYFLGVLGMPGLTAYSALLGVGQPKPGETVLISAAAGAVGQLAGQIAKIRGCRVIGTAGAADKLAYIKDELGFDAAVDYKGKDRDALGAELAALAPDGIDVFYDNVGGVLHDAVMANLALHARIVIVGSISIYDRLETPDIGIRWNRQLMSKRARMEGFLVWDWRHQTEEFRRDVSGWLRSGKVRYKEDIVDGVAAAPKAFMGLLAGENRGKLLVRVAASAD